MTPSGRFPVPLIRSFLVLSIALFGAQTAAKDEVRRFDNGPLLSEPGQFFEMSADVLNRSDNSFGRQKPIAFVERLASSRMEYEEFTDTQSADELARGYMVSVDGWLSGSVKQQLAREFLANPEMREFGAALQAGVSQMPDGSELRLPPGQTITLHHGGILFTGDQLSKRGFPKRLA